MEIIEAPPIPWRLVQRKTRQWTPVLLCVSMSVLSLSYLAVSAPRAYEYWLERAPLRDFAKDAARRNISYEDAVQDPAAAQGKPVRWFITHPGDSWYYGEDQNKPVRWDGAPPDMAVTGQSGSSRGRWVLATVAGTTPTGVRLALRGLD